MLLSADEEPGMSFLGYSFADNRGVLSEDIQSQEALLSTEQEARMHALCQSQWAQWLTILLPTQNRHPTTGDIGLCEQGCGHAILNGNKNDCQCVDNLGERGMPLGIQLHKALLSADGQGSGHVTFNGQTTCL